MVTGFKSFNTVRGLRGPYGHLWEIFRQVAKHGCIMAIHAEDDDIETLMEDMLEREGYDQGFNLHMVQKNTRWTSPSVRYCAWPGMRKQASTSGIPPLKKA